MLSIETKELKISDKLKRRIDMLGRFTSSTLVINNGCIKNRLLRPKDKERYNEFTIDLYEHNAVDEETFIDI